MADNLTPEQEKYLNDTMDYLEYLGYPEYILDFDPEDVAWSLAKAILTLHEHKTSVRMAALAIFGVTFETQIIPHFKKSKVM